MPTSCKCISFTLFGKHPKYLVGALKNVDLANKLLPDYQCYIFHDGSVPGEFISALNQKSNTKLIDMTGSVIPATMWRFLAIDFPEVELMLSRDTDSRISERECAIIREWEKESTKFMIIKDHPGSHGTFEIFAGLWAMKKFPGLNINQLIEGWISHKTSFALAERTADQVFLNEMILPYTLNTIAYYDDFNLNGKAYCRKIPVKREGWRFIGEIFDEHDQPEYHWKALRGHYFRSRGVLGYCFAKVYSFFIPEWR